MTGAFETRSSDTGNEIVRVPSSPSETLALPIDGAGRGRWWARVGAGVGQGGRGGGGVGRAYGGNGRMQELVCTLGLAEAIDQRLHLLKMQLPYHESDHVLNLAYNTQDYFSVSIGVELGKSNPQR